MKIYGFVSGDIMSRANLSYEDVCYAVKLAGISNRRNQPQNAGKFSGLMNNIGNVISDTFSSAVNNIYLLRLNNGVISVVSEKMVPLHINAVEVYRSLSFTPGLISGMARFLQGEIESANFKISIDRFEETFCGNFKQFIMDFDNEPLYPYTNLSEQFVTVVYSGHKQGGEPFQFAAYKKVGSLLSFDMRSVYIHNDSRKIDYSAILACTKKQGYYGFLIKEHGEYELVEIFSENLKDINDMEINLVREVKAVTEVLPEITFPESVPVAEMFLSHFVISDLSIVAIDGKIFYENEKNLEECGIFKVGDEVFVSKESGVSRYTGGNKIAAVLFLLPMGFDSYFLTNDGLKPFYSNSEILEFAVNDEGIHSENKEYRYDKMSGYRYEADDFCCKIEFSCDGENVQMYTANSLGVHISNMQEKMLVTSDIKQYSINELYACYYDRFMQNFLATTFAEIFKTRKLMNNEMDVEELLGAMNATEGDVLRGAFKSVLAKFKNVDDMQSTLIQKVALLEIQRRKIQKMYEEWALYYPHHMANIQVNWIKNMFGNAVDNKILQDEYWKCVVHFKKTLSSSNAFVQKSMNEIGMCTAKIMQALPEEVKRCDVTRNLRINSSNSTAMLKTGSNLLLGASAGLEMTTIFLRGFSGASPLALSMSAKMLVDSYAKDVELRKNVRAFGMQALEWWIIFLKGIRIHIMEMTHSVNMYNKHCLKRDTGIFKQLPMEKRDMIMTKLSLGLKDKIIAGIDDKFMEIMPQFNMRVSNIIEELDKNTQLCDYTIEEFGNNLFI